MPFYPRVYSPGELQFITTSTYRCTPLFLSDRFRRSFVQRLERVAQSCSVFWNYSAAFIFSQHPQKSITNLRTAE